MAPNTTAGALFVETTTTDVNSHSVLSSHNNSSEESSSKQPQPRQIVWRNVVLFVYLHTAALYGVYLAITSSKLATTLFAYCLHIMGGLGITAGAHRLWAHKSYKAKKPLQIILMIFNTLAFQNSIFEWSRDHRVHHKFSETDADPHNATRGLFFSHMGWLLVKKHPEVYRKGKTVQLTDLDNDPVVAFQKKYYLVLMPILCFLIPTVLPVYLWGESWSNAWFVAALLRYTFTLHVTWLVNSVAHFYGNKPYDKFINPAQNLFVAILAIGEGWHNYHHTFPWDYKTAELGNYRANFTTLFIDFFAKIGWAYELKSVSSELIAKRALRTGDGSPVAAIAHVEGQLPILPPHEELDNPVWGWDDNDMPADEKVNATVVNGHQHTS